MTTLWDGAADQIHTLPSVRMRQTRRPTGELLRRGRWYRVTVSPVRDPSNAVRAVYIVSDITEWKQLEEERARLLTREQTARAEAEAASRAKDDFLAMLSHELRSPLAPIRLAMHTLGGQADHDPVLARARDVVERQVRHLARLVDDLLDVARLTRQQVELQREIVSVEQIVTDALEATRPLIEERAHRLSVSLPEDSIWLDGDPTRLVQVIANLLTNAAKYTPPGGNVWVTASLEGEEVTVRVRDTGIGIPAELLPHVFEMFTQGDRSPARPEGGLGLGLTIARAIVARHGGG